MKKVIAFIILSFLFYKYYFDKKVPTPSHSQTIKEDKVTIKSKILKNVSKKMPSKSETSKEKDESKEVLTEELVMDEVMDFSKSEKQLIKKFGPVYLYDFSKAMLAELANCIENDCGIEYDKKKFYDKDLTLGHSLIARNLSLLNTISKEASIFSFNVTDVDLDKFLELKSKDTFIPAYELKLNYSEDIEKVIKEVNLNSADKYDAFVTITYKHSMYRPQIEQEVTNKLISKMKETSGEDRIANIEAFSKLNANKENKEQYYKEICDSKKSYLIKAANKKLNIPEDSQCL